MAVIAMSHPSPSPRKTQISRATTTIQASERARARALRVIVQGVCQRIQAHNLSPQNAPRHYLPRMDLYDDERSPTIYAMLELPGVSRDNISVKVQGGLLVVDGRRGSPLLDKIDMRGRNGTAHATSTPFTSAFKVKELKYGDFHREIALPEHCTTEDIVAEMTDGMLLLSWPRMVRIPTKTTNIMPSLSTATTVSETAAKPRTHLDAEV